MASLNAAINLIINGGSKIDQVIDKANRLESIVNNINKTPLEVNVDKAKSSFDKIDSELKAARTTLSNLQTTYDKSAKSINDYAGEILDLQKKLGTLTPNTQKYNAVLEKHNKVIRERAAAQNTAANALVKISKQESKIEGLEKGVNVSAAAKKASIALETLAGNYLRLGKAQDTVSDKSTISSLAAQAEALKLVANNSEIASSQFNRYSIAAQAASQKIFQARQKQLGALAFGLSPEAPKVNLGRGGAGSIAGARNLVGSLIASGSDVVKSEAALSDYADRLRSLQSVVPYTSNEFRALEEALAGVNNELNEARRLASGIGLRGQKSAIQPLSGPATDLGSLRAFQLRESYEKKVNNQLNLQDKIQERISQATLFDFQKKKLTLQLDEAVAALAENRLGDAQRLTREIDRQRISMERMNRAAQKPQVFGALGTAFMPVTGELPGGELAPGSPAAKVAEAKANRESTEAAVALARQKQKAIEDEADELRKGTQAATALGKQKLKALEDEAKRLRDETSNAVALAQQKMREEERAIAQAWKMRGGPALPPSMGGGTAGVRGQAFRAGGPGAATAALDAPRRVESLVRSAQLAQEKLTGLEIRGVDVTAEKASAQRILNSLKKQDLQISDQLLSSVDDELNLIRDVLRLEKQRLANQRLLDGGGSKKTGAEGSGLEAALKRLEEARTARQTFLGGASPAQAIDQIVRGFNADKPAQNITNTFAQNLQGGAKQMTAAATSAFTAVVDAIEKVFGIASPSRVMQEIASNLISSFITELVSNIPSVKAALEQTFTAKNVDFEQPGRGLPRRAPLATELDPGYLAALSGNPLTRGRPSPAGIFSAPAARVEAPGSAFPFQTYDMSYPQFPVEAAAQVKPPSSLKNRPSDTSSILSASIKEYRAAIDNFWEGEDSQFDAIKKVVASSARLAAAQLARRLQQAKDLTPEQQFQQTAGEARALLSAGRQSGISRLASTANEFIVGDRQFGISQAVGATVQRISDSVLNSIEALGFSVSNSFEDGIDRIRSGVPNAVSRGLSAISGGFGGFGGFGGAGGGGAGGAGDTPNQVAQLLGLDGIGDISRASVRELEALSAAASELRAVLDPTTEGFDRLDNQLRETIGQIGRQLERRDPNADLLTRRFGPRGGRAVSEGLIGGAFPLLFGQGVGAAVGGGAGGALGGFAGGGLGFGLSLAGTALGTAFDTLLQKSDELASALAKPAENFDKLKEVSFISSRSLEKQIDKTLEYGNEVGASTLIQEEAIRKLGVSGVSNLSRLETESDRANRAFAELGQQMQAVTAGPLASVKGFFADIAERAAAGGRVKALREGLTGDERKRFEADLQERLKSAGIQRGFFGGEASQAEIGLLANQGQLQDIVDKWSNIVVEGEIKITNEEKIRTQINALSKYAEAQQSRLSVLDISKGLVDQVKNTARQQEDLDRQRFDLVESYERSIADIRLGVEKQITQERLENISKENQLFSAQGDIRLQQLKNANADLKDSMFGNEFGQQLADIVSEFTEKQLSAENEIANRKRNLALELERKDVQVEEFRLGVAKQVSDLNLSTEKQVAQIRLSTLRQNQDYDQKRFEFEKRLAVTRLQSEILIAKQKRAEAIEQLKQEKDPGRINLLSSQAQIFTDLERQIPDFIRQIEQSAGPRKLSFGLPAIGGSVSTAGYESLAAKGKQLSQDLEVLQSQFDGLVRKGDIKNFSSQLNALADQGVARLSTELDDLRATIDGTELQRSFGRIADSFASIKGSKGVIESVLSGPIQVLIEFYSALSIENKKLADSLEFVNEVTRNHSEAISAAKTEINSLLSGTTEYEKTLFNLKSRGLSPATEEFQRLIQSAQEVDRLNQKVAVINTLKTAGTELSLSMRQLIEDFVELGDASEAALRFSEEMGKKGMKLALDIAFKPIEESMQQGLITFAEKLGFDVKPESQKQLEAISAIKSSVDTIKQEISQFLAKIPSVSVSENLTTNQRDFIRDQINQAMGINASPVQKNQPAQSVQATPDSSVQKLDVVPYTEATQAVESLNKVGQGATQLAEQASVAAQSIDANVASVAQSVQNSGKQVESVIPAWGASLGKVVTGLAGAIAGVAGISGGITQMKGGGTYGVLTGLSSIFGAIGSIAGAFGSFSSLGGAAKGFSGGYFDPMTGLGAAGPNFGFAKGGMFTNSIVSSPTLFKFADGGLARNGLMGEAGPEAIMPLTRGPDGRLGVDANGLSDAIAEARGALDETGLNLDGQDSEEAQSANSDQNTFNNSDRKAAAATDSVKELNYVLQDSRGAIEDMKRVSRDREAAAAAIAASPDAKELYKLLAPMGKETSTIRELLGSSAGSDSASIAGILGSDGRQGDQSDAILAARNAIADGIEINAGQVDGSASDAITSSRELVEKINNTEKAQLAIQSQEDKSALDSARSAASTDASTKQYFNTKVENNAGQVDGSASSVIKNSREFVEKINNTEKTQLAAQSQENKSALDSARSAISKDSSSKEYFDTKESSALMQARETTDSMMALTQTRQMLNSVATVNKERSVERAIEATASGPVKPIDVRYESQVINSVEYVTAEQHRKGISEAAERGRSLTLSALKNSVKARRQIGM